MRGRSDGCGGISAADDAAADLCQLPSLADDALQPRRVCPSTWGDQCFLRAGRAACKVVVSGSRSCAALASPCRFPVRVPLCPVHKLIRTLRRQRLRKKTTLSNLVIAIYFALAITLLFFPHDTAGLSDLVAGALEAPGSVTRPVREAKCLRG